MLGYRGTRRIHFVILLVAIGAVGGTSTRAADRGKQGEIAFFANLNGVAQIHSVNSDGTDLFQVTELPPSNDTFALAPDFLPHGPASRLSSRYGRRIGAWFGPFAR